MIENSSYLAGLSSLERILETEDCCIKYLDNIIFFEPKKGSEINFSREISLLIQAVDHFGDLPFVYISNQCQHSAVMLYDYKYLEMLPNLIGTAIVLDNEFNHIKINPAKSQFKKPLKVFASLSKAQKWSKALIQKKKFNK